MGIERIVCLANSYKHENRCVAGISLTTMRWVRLIGRTVPGCVTRNQTCYASGKEAAILDLFEAELAEPCDSNCHPEDIYITNKRWVLVRRFDKPSDIQILNVFVNHQPTILHGVGDRVHESSFQDKATDRSLELVEPVDLSWCNREEMGKQKARAQFGIGMRSRIRYDLSVTDPVFLNQLHLLPLGVYSHSMLSKKPDCRTMLAISLSEPFHGYHYRLVAGVVQLPA
jgi:hypothetical protein